MSAHRRTRTHFCLCLAVLLGWNSVGTAQTDKIVKDGKVVPRSTVLEFEIITNSAASAVDSQHWSRELAKQGYSVRVRSAQFNETPGVTENMTGLSAGTGGPFTMKSESSCLKV